MCGCFCFVVVPYAFLEILAFVFLWGCLAHVGFIHVLGCLFIQTVRLKIHHGGMFIYQPFTLYINGHIEEEEWGWDVDTMSYIDFKKKINSLGYKSFMCLWYKDPRKALSRG